MKLKKLLALLLALMMVVCVFAACNEEPANNDDDDDKEKTEETAKKEDEAAEEGEAEEVAVSDEDQAGEAVVKFMELYMAGDEAALDYVAEDLKADAGEAIEMIAMMKDGFSIDEEMGIDTSELSESDKAAAEELMNDVVDEIFSSIEVTVNGATIDGDTAVVNATLSMMDMSALYSLDYMLEDASTIDDMKAVVDSALEEAKANTTSETSDINLIKENGKWVISEL